MSAALAISKVRYSLVRIVSPFDKAGLKTRLYDPPLQLADRHPHAARDAVFADEHVDVHGVCLSPDEEMPSSLSTDRATRIRTTRIGSPDMSGPPTTATV